MKIGILQAGLCPDELLEEHGEYDVMFARFLDGYGFEFEGFRVVEGLFPSSIEAADGWLITGSKYGAYEDHDWIAPLEDFIRHAYVQNVPIVGICFGHQIMAQALGGRVEKFAGGWSVGKQHYQLEGVEGGIDLMAWHQDQVTELPADAEVIGSSDFCCYAVLSYGNKAVSVQAHPEFDAGFIKGLFDAREAVLPPQIRARKNDDLSGELSSPTIARMMADVLKRKSQ
jgi:GMP synthase-like glutamine amidotransferase